MKVCLVQRSGIRYFNKFTNLTERDKLEIELRIEDKSDKLVHIDLTSALLEEYSKHPDIKVGSVPIAEAAVAQHPKPIKIVKSTTARPAYREDSTRQKDDIVAKVKEAQIKAAEENKKKQAEIAAARAERLAAARQAKADKAKASSKPTVSNSRTTTPAKPSKGTNTAEKITKTHVKAIEKTASSPIRTLAKLPQAPTKAATPSSSAKPSLTKSIAKKADSVRNAQSTPSSKSASKPQSSTTSLEQSLRVKESSKRSSP
jgi:hypothetical protein